jgi:hypothetical protein
VKETVYTQTAMDRDYWLPPTVQESGHSSWY